MAIRKHLIEMSTELYEIFRAAGIPREIRTTLDINKLRLVGKSIGYLTASRQGKYCGESWYTDENARPKYEYTIKPGRLFKRIWPEKTDKEIEIMVERFNKELSIHDNPNIQVWGGKKIKKAYLNVNESGKGSSLVSSCMCYDSCQKSLDFYSKNGCDIVVIVNSDGFVVTRAILWPKIYFPYLDKKFRFMDRIYYKANSQKLQVAKFAETEDFVYRNIHTDTGQFYYNKKGFSDEIALKVTLDGITHLPYTDTMKELYYKDKILVNIPSSTLKLKEPNCMVRLSAAGAYTPQIDPNSIQELFTEQWVSKNDCMLIAHYSGYVLRSNIVRVGRRNYSKHDPDVVNMGGSKYNLKRNCIYSNVAGKYILIKDALEICDIVCDKKTKTYTITVKDSIPDTKDYIVSFVFKLDTGEYIHKTDKNVKYLEAIDGTDLWRLKPLDKKKLNDIDKYQTWINKELKKLQPCMPNPVYKIPELVEAYYGEPEKFYNVANWTEKDTQRC